MGDANCSVESPQTFGHLQLMGDQHHTRAVLLYQVPPQTIVKQFPSHLRIQGLLVGLRTPGAGIGGCAKGDGCMRVVWVAMDLGLGV